MPNKVVAGIAWFRPEQWELLRSLAADVDCLEEDYSDWLAHAEKTVRELSKHVIVQKVDVDVHQLQAWCVAANRPLDSSARAAYAADRLKG